MSKQRALVDGTHRLVLISNDQSSEFESCISDADDNPYGSTNEDRSNENRIRQDIRNESSSIYHPNSTTIDD